MNAQKFTQKSLEAIQDAHNLAIEYQNMQIEQAHLLVSLLKQQNGLIRELFKKMEVDPDEISTMGMAVVEKLPRVTGSGRESGKVYVSSEMDILLTTSEKIAEQMKDEYVSVEHLILAMLEKPDAEMRRLFASKKYYEKPISYSVAGRSREYACD